MQLALGTVQFGLAYGIAGSGHAVPHAEARRILDAAWQQGVRTLDTASAYGDIEERLADLCGPHRFRIVSKVPAIPAGLTPAQAADWAVASATRSRQRLGERLEALMVHRAEDLLGARGAAVYAALQQWALESGTALGASCYGPDEMVSVHGQHRLAIAQLPGNVLDQRLPQAFPTAVSDVEIHLRSAFLQGLLLMDAAAGRSRLPVAGAALQRWHAWCQAAEIKPLVGALSVVKSFAAVSQVVVGVETLAQFEDIAHAWSSSMPRPAPQLADSDTAVIDPRSWRP